VDVQIPAGTAQFLARVRAYDAFDNLTDTPRLTTLTFSNATDASVGIRSSTGTLALMSTGAGVGLYDVDGAKFTFAGKYTLSSPEVAQMSGAREFNVRPLAPSSITFQPSTTAVAVGDENAIMTITYRDRYGNASEPAVFPLDIEFNGVTVSSNGTLTLERPLLDTSSVPLNRKFAIVRSAALGDYVVGVATAKLGRLTTKGEYAVRIRGTSLSQTGITTFRVIGYEPYFATFVPSVENVCDVNMNVEVSMAVRDSRGNPTDNVPVRARFVVTVGGAEVQRGNLELVLPVDPVLSAQGIVRFRLLAPLVPGVYRFFAVSPTVDEENSAGELRVCGPATAMEVSSPAAGACITAGNSLVPLSIRLLDADGTPTTVPNTLRATFTGTAINGASAGTVTLQLDPATGLFREALPRRIFTTAGTYSLLVVGDLTLETQITSVVNFCVQPDVAAIGVVSGVTPTILVNGSQTPVLTVRDRWYNLTDYAGTLTYAGAASGAVALTRRSVGVYDGATTPFGVGGAYAFVAGVLEMRGAIGFSIVQPTIALSQTRLDLNASVTTTLMQDLTISGSFDIPYQSMPTGTIITVTAPTGFLISTPTCGTPVQQCILTVSGSGSVRVTVNFVRTPQTLAGSYSGVITVVSGSNIAPPTSVQVQSEAYSCGDAFPDPPKITFLVLHTDLNSYFNYWRGERQTNPRVGRFRGADNMREYVLESLDLSNLINRNSGVNLRFSLDPVILSTSAVVNVNGVTGALTTGIRDNWYYESQNNNDRYVFGGGEFDIVSNLVSNTASLLSRFQESVQADIVVLVGSVPYSWTDIDGNSRGVVSAAGIAPGVGITSSLNSFFIMDINRTYPKSLVFTHEVGHLSGGSHDVRDWSFITESSAGAIMEFPANPPTQTATIDFGWYHGGQYRYNQEFVTNGRNLELAALRTPSSIVDVGTIMAQLQPKVMNWSNPTITVTIPESGVFLPTGNRPAGNFIGTPYQVRNMAARMNANSTIEGVGGGQTVANFHREHITYIDASISGVRTLAAGASSVYRVNVCGTLAIRPFTFRWFIQQAGTQVFTQVGTEESYSLDMPNNREVRLRVEVTDNDNHRVTAEAYISCNACAAPPVTFAAFKGVSSVTGSTTGSLDYEMPLCAGVIVNPPLARTASTAKQSAAVSNQYMPTTSQLTAETEEIPNTVTLDAPYPNPGGDEITVSFSIPKAGYVSIGLYDVLGREAVPIAHDECMPGRKTFRVLVRTLPSGMYMLRLRTGEGKIIAKPITIAR
jgi:hypothetical protein